MEKLRICGQRWLAANSWRDEPIFDVVVVVVSLFTKVERSELKRHKLILQDDDDDAKSNNNSKNINNGPNISSCNNEHNISNRPKINSNNNIGNITKTLATTTTNSNNIGNND